jgi:leucyl-tRNA synthetase
VAAAGNVAGGEPSAPVASARKAAHRAVRKVTGDVADRFHFNTAISALMELVNELASVESLPGGADRAAMAESLRTTLLLLAPFSPHVSEELWSVLGNEGCICLQSWPSWDEDLIREDLVTVAVQVDGKVRGRVTLPAGAGEEEAVAAALADPQVARHLEGREPAKRVYVPGRLLNLVLGR